MSEDLYQKLSAAVERMPAFPESVHKVMELTADINCSPKDLVAVIERDVVMTAKILKLVNSAYFGLSRKIQNVNHAVVFVGLNTVKNLALSIATIGTLPDKNPAGFDITGFLTHSLATASLTRLLAQRAGVPAVESSNYFVAGLLHDFGKAVLALFMGAEFKAALALCEAEGIPLNEAEYRILGTDHAEIGAMLCERWQLPEELVAATRDHHAMNGAASIMRDSVFAANQIVKRYQFGNSGNPTVEPFPPDVTARFGELDALIESLGDLQPEMDKAAAFAGT